MTILGLGSFETGALTTRAFFAGGGADSSFSSLRLRPGLADLEAAVVAAALVAAPVFFGRPGGFLTPAGWVKGF